MSFASTNNSFRWGLYPGTPTADRPDWIESYKNDVNIEETREIAVKVAL